MAEAGTAPGGRAAERAARVLLVIGDSPLANTIDLTLRHGHYVRRITETVNDAKAAIANFTRTIAVQLAPHNIRVNAIVPNKIGSPVGRDEFDPTRPVMNMLRRAGRPEEAAKAILFLASEDSSFVIGENLFVDGGTMAMDQTGA